MKSSWTRRARRRLSTWGIGALMSVVGTASAQTITVIEEYQLGDPNPDVLTQFGARSAFSGDTLAVWGAGRVHVFERSGVLWNVTQTILPDRLLSVTGFALEGDRLVVAGPQGAGEPGMGIVYERSNGTFEIVADLEGNDVTPTSQFGEDVDLSGDTIVVGAPGHDLLRGAAYVFCLSGSTWSQEAKLVDLNADVADNFGASVALDGNATLIGAPGNDVACASDDCGTGAAFLFERTARCGRRQRSSCRRRTPLPPSVKRSNSAAIWQRSGRLSRAARGQRTCTDVEIRAGRKRRAWGGPEMGSASPSSFRSLCCGSARTATAWS